jgi:hypothetical protein
MPRAGWPDWRRCRRQSRTTGVTVLFDGTKRLTCLHRDFISPIVGNGSWLR